MVSSVDVYKRQGIATHKYMSRILKDAYTYGLISKDIRPELVNVPKKVPKMTLLSKNELKKLIQEASKHQGIYFEILLALFVGLRSGEVREMCIRDRDIWNVMKKYRTVKRSKHTGLTVEVWIGLGNKLMCISMIKRIEGVVK